MRHIFALIPTVYSVLHESFFLKCMILICLCHGEWLRASWAGPGPREWHKGPAPFRGFALAQQATADLVQWKKKVGSLSRTSAYLSH